MKKKNMTKGMKNMTKGDIVKMLQHLPDNCLVQVGLKDEDGQPTWYEIDHLSEWPNDTEHVVLELNPIPVMC